MKKSKNKVYRWIAMMLTAVLLVGQCQMPVLANEGTAPAEAGVSDENKDDAQGGSGAADKDAPKDGEEGTENGGGEGGAGNGDAGEAGDGADNSGTEEGGGDTGNGDTGEAGTGSDNGGIGEGGDGSDNSGTGEGGNGETGSENGDADDDGEDISGAGDNGTGDEGENNGGEEGAPDKCVCETACTEDAVNMDCPVCAADYVACAKNAGEGVAPSEEIGEEESVSENELETMNVLTEKEKDTGDYAAVHIFQDGNFEYELIGSRPVTARLTKYKGLYGSYEMEIPQIAVKSDGGFSDGEYTVTEIGDGAFENTYFQKVKMPNSITKIGERAFAKCSLLESVEMSTGIIDIGKEAFFRCKKLKSLEIPEGTVSIGVRAFEDCEVLQGMKLPESLVTIGGGAFSSTAISEINIPSKVTRIDGTTFYACRGLQVVDIPDNVTVIEGSAFAYCYSLREVTLTNNITYIGDHAFAECVRLKSINIPKGLTQIRSNTFYNCRELEGEIVFPHGITAIGPDAFYNCRNLTGLRIPSTVTYISSQAFASCVQMMTMHIAVNQSNTIPTVVNGNAFIGCKTPRDIIFMNEDGTTELTGERLKEVRRAYLDVDDGKPKDGCWYGWRVAPVSVVSIQPYKDDEVWDGHGKKYILSADNGGSFLENQFTVEEGEYAIYETRPNNQKIETGISVKVEEEDVEGRIDYYTVQFYDNEIPYGSDTPQKPQIILKSMGRVSKPWRDPEKKGYLFEKWVTQDKNTDFNFSEMAIERPTSIYAKWTVNTAPTHPVTINVQIDNVSRADHNRTFALTKDNAATFTTDLDAVEPGTYEIYDVTGVSSGDEYGTKGMNTGVTVEVTNTDTSATVDYYTAAFYDIDDGGNEVKYGDDKDQKPQTILKTVGRVTKPVTDPEKAGYTFDKWVIAPNGDDEFNFASAEITAPTKIYAKWKVNPVPTHTVTINVKKDGNPWSNHGRTFALLGGGGSGFLEATGQTGDSSYTVSQVPNGTYHIYDITGVPADSLYSRARDTGAEMRVSGADTEVDVMVNGADEEKDVHYYTATFYDGTEAYKAGTPQEPQIILRGKKAAKPEDPQKADWQFAGWKTTDGGAMAYDFDGAVTDTTSIFASWVEKTAEQLHITADATEGGTIDPTGDIVVTKGGEQSFIITPNEGYKIKTVTVDGKDVTAGLKDTLARARAGARYYTFTNVTEDHTIHAAFEADGGDKPGEGDDNPGDDDKPDDGGDDKPDDGDDKPDDDGDKPGGGGDKPDPGDDTPDGGGDNPASDGNTPGGETVQVTVVSQTSSPQALDGAGSSEGAPDTSAAERTANGREPKTGDADFVEVYATLAMIAGLTYLLLYFMEEGRGMTEREKEVFVAAFIRWAKKGGRFRKCCAIAAIFCLLVYYHSIGKRAGRVGYDRECLRQSL